MKGIAVLDCFTTTADEPSTAIDLVSADCFVAWRAEQDARVASWVETNEFRGQAGRLLAVPDAAGEVERVVFGLGASEDRLMTAELPGVLRKGVYHVARALPDQSAFDVMMAWALGSYRFDAYKSGTPSDLPRLRVPQDAPVHEVSRIVEGLYLARDLVNTPANDMGPAELERAVMDLGRRHGAQVQTIVGDALLERNFRLIHAVGRASSRAPRLLDLTWGPVDGPLVTLVGKGVCFDSGGLNIKPASGMELMKKDMGGAASVLGLAHMIMALGLPIRLRVLIPAVENAIGSNAFRPGDVYRARNGSTVEIGNTDAEGRLVLADAMSLGDEDSPDLMVVMATLTGAARVALGPEIVPFYTPDDRLAAEMAQTSMATQDSVWRMPLHAPYMKLLESRVADVSHISQGQFAGSITAALFLSRFVKKASSWVHFDLYAWNAQARPGRPIGGEAQAIRALFRLLKQRYTATGATCPEPEGGDQTTPSWPAG